MTPHPEEKRSSTGDMPSAPIRRTPTSTEVPFPPLELMKIVGPTDPAAFDNPSGRLTWGDLAIGPLSPGAAYRKVFDFGCGCGRNARQLLLQHSPPEKYVGVDVNRQMIDWCESNLAPVAPQFEFHHHDVWSATYAPKNSRNPFLPLSSHGRGFTLVIAHSVFTHLYENQTRFYLRECRELIDENGVIRTTWFFFNRAWFPVLAPFQHCIYVNENDPTQAVYYDWRFFLELLRELDLKIVEVTWTKKAGFQNQIHLAKGAAFTDLKGSIEPPATIMGFGPSTPRDAT